LFFAYKTNSLIGENYMYINGAQAAFHPLFIIVLSIVWSLADWAKPLFTDEIFEGGFGRLPKFLVWGFGFPLRIF
jgi:hypothetical protein